MMKAELLREYEIVQAAAKSVLSKIVHVIKPGLSESDIANSCVRMLQEQDISQTWYYDVPAFVLVGNRTARSLSGKDYRPDPQAIVEENELVAIDLSPCRGHVWGDCARSFVIGDKEYRDTMDIGLGTEYDLHELLMADAAPEMTFGDLFEWMNGEIQRRGFENLDFLGNLGHSIERRRQDRRYIDSGNSTRLGDVGLFTFEPHIRPRGGAYGFKHENIYYFRSGKLCEL